MLKAALTSPCPDTHFDMMWIILIFYQNSSRLLLLRKREIHLRQFSDRTSRYRLELKSDCLQRSNTLRVIECALQRLKKTSEKTVSSFNPRQAVDFQLTMHQKIFFNSSTWITLPDGQKCVQIFFVFFRKLTVTTPNRRVRGANSQYFRARSIRNRESNRTLLLRSNPHNSSQQAPQESVGNPFHPSPGQADLYR